MSMFLQACLSRGTQFHFKSPRECNPSLASSFPAFWTIFQCVCVSVWASLSSFFLPILAPALYIIPFSMSAKMGLVAPPAWLPRCIIPEPWFAVSAHLVSSIESRTCLFDEFSTQMSLRVHAVMLSVCQIWLLQIPATILQSTNDHQFCLIHTYLMLFICLKRNINSITPTPHWNIHYPTFTSSFKEPE